MVIHRPSQCCDEFVVSHAAAGVIVHQEIGLSVLVLPGEDDPNLDGGDGSSTGQVRVKYGSSTG